MTVSSIVPVNNHTGNSSVKKFDFDFLIEDENELIVQYTNKSEETKILTLGVDYSINEIGNPNGSYIIFPLESSAYNVLRNDEKISLMLTLSIKQESEFKNSSYFNLNILEWTFDYIIRILQVLNRKIDRSVKISEGANYTPDELINQIKTSEVKAVNAANIAENAKTFIEQNEALYCVAEDIQGPNNIAQVLENKVNIDKVANSISNINIVGNDIDNINSVAENEDNINLLNSNKNNINICASNIDTIKTVYQTSINSIQRAKNWAVSDSVVENGLYSAKYYAEHAQGLSDVTYNDLRASSALENNGDLLTNEEAFANIQTNAHSTFNLSNFNVIGDLDITQNGIASGFSTANYIKLPALESEPQELEINCKFKGSSTSTAPQNQIFGWYDGESSLFRVFWYLKNTIRLDFTIPGATSLVSLSYSGNINDEYIIRITYKNEVLKLYVNDELAGNYEGKVNLSCLTGTSGKIGSQSIGGWYFGNGLIDLKYFNIKVNGETIYSGNKTGVDVINNIEIPYTLSKTGSKIVDAVYRDRVQDVYSQYGSAMYYTLDEGNKNFTLPMGEIYGMIEQKADETAVNTQYENLNNNKCNKDGSNAQFPYVVEKYTNGSEGYRLYSDNFCIQFGHILASQQVTLLKPMLNTDYNISFSPQVNGTLSGNQAEGWKNKTKTGFNINLSNTNGCDWCVQGYINTAADDEYVDEQEPSL